MTSPSQSGPRKRKTVSIDARIRSTPVVLTPDLARRLVDRAAFISLAHKCPCRERRDCKDYPVDFGCLYLGDGARGTVTKGMAVEIDRQEALEHVHRAREQGLVHIVLWTSAELRSLGTGAKKALELCSCCSCCCLSRRTGDGSKAYIDGITGLGVARAEGNCTACGLCMAACPFGAITIGNDGPEINADRCKGCGRCGTACESGVLSVHELEMVPTYSGGWQMVPAEDFLDEILKTIQ